MIKTVFKIPVLAVISYLSLVSCIDDSITTTSTDCLSFSVDSLKMGDLFSDEMSPTFRFTVRNKDTKGVELRDVYISDAQGAEFYVNVDGFPSDVSPVVEIRGKDSIYVLVKALPEANLQTKPVEIGAWLNFVYNGTTSRIRIYATSTDVVRLKDEVIDHDTHLSAERPYMVFGDLTVQENVTLTIPAGVKMYFYDKAALKVNGTLICEGVAGSPVEMRGTRTGNVVGDISFELMSRQWDGVYFSNTSKNNQLNNTVIKNTVSGVNVDGEENEKPVDITLINCVLRNSGTKVLSALNSTVTAVGCEFAEAAEGLVDITGGKGHKLINCTIANNYLFSAVTGPGLGIYPPPADSTPASESSNSHLPDVEVINSIFYGLGKALSPGDLTGSPVRIKKCSFGGEGYDDENFIACLWDTDPMFYTVRGDYYFNYRLQPDSPVLNIGDTIDWTLYKGSEIDFYGNRRGVTPDLGAYVFDPSYKPDIQE